MDDKMLKILIVAGIVIILLLVIIIVLLRNRAAVNNRMYNHSKIKMTGGADIEGGQTSGGTGLNGFCEDKSETLVVGVSRAIRRTRLALNDCSTGYRFEGQFTDSLILGRYNEHNRANYLEIKGHKTISKEHLLMVNNNGYIYIRDLGSSNHTWHNGRLLTSQELLSSGDIIKMGNAEFIVELR